jgi:hypothetical protein
MTDPMTAQRVARMVHEDIVRSAERRARENEQPRRLRKVRFGLNLFGIR